MKEFFLTFSSFYWGCLIGVYFTLKYKMNCFEEQIIYILGVSLSFSCFGVYYKIETVEFWCCVALGAFLSEVTINIIRGDKNLS